MRWKELEALMRIKLYSPVAPIVFHMKWKLKKWKQGKQNRFVSRCLAMGGGEILWTTRTTRFAAQSACPWPSGEGACWLAASSPWAPNCNLLQSPGPAVTPGRYPGCWSRVDRSYPSVPRFLLFGILCCCYRHQSEALSAECISGGGKFSSGC